MKTTWHRSTPGWSEILNQHALKPERFYSAIGISPKNKCIAIDLGCGHGVHTVVLAKLGFQVVAIDNSSQLLSELAANSQQLPVEIINDDLSRFPNHVAGKTAALIVCMGDTLTHLSDISCVDKLLQDVALHLTPDGIFAVSFRDYAKHEIFGADRFIPVRLIRNESILAFSNTKMTKCSFMT